MTEHVDVVFVEDSEVDVELALLALQRDGLAVSFRRTETEAQLREALTHTTPAAILSDFSMPQFDGMQALRLARELAPMTPFIFVSGTIGEERAIEAIRLGATDYILKNNMRRLPTAVRRALAEAEEKRKALAVEQERARLVEILEATSDYVGMTDPEGRIIYVNAAWRRLAGAGAESLSGRMLDELLPPAARDVLRDQALPASQGQGLWHGETAVLAADGSEVPVSQVLIAHRDAQGGVRFRSTVARDISERKAYEARIKYLANYDALTGLPNRSLLGDRAVQALSHARRSGRTCALVVLSVDRFELLNESFGHGAGDALLKQVASRLRETIAEGDTAARLGADVFCVLASDLGRPEDVRNLVRKVAEAVERPYPIGEGEVHVGLSMGASTFPRDGEDFDLLLRNADAAMHRVKRGGGKGFEFYAAAMTRDALERLELESALRDAIGRGEIELHYQPQVEIGSGRIAGVEALMRWRHPRHGMVSPGRFIPIAEESDLIEKLGEWALQDACRTLGEWDRAGHHSVRLAVNVSARQFRSKGFLDLVRSTVRQHQLKPGRLELELTESVLIEDREEAISILEKLKALGVLIAVDDFGTGYSSLSYLSGLPVDCLKIDRAFVTSVARGGRDAAIAQAIISLAHSLGLRVLAEGVETAEQQSFLHAHGCDEGQGYLFARPAPAEAAAALLRAGTLTPVKQA